MPYDTCYDVDALNLACETQANLIKLNAVQNLVINAPYCNLYDGGTWEAFTGATRTQTVPGRTVLNQDMVNPTATAKVDLCGWVGPTAYGGATNFTTTMGGYRGRSEDICLHQAFHAVEGALEVNQRNLVEGIKEFMEADCRANLLVQSGHKFNAAWTAAGQNFFNMLNGGEKSIAVDFPALGLPDSSMPHQALVYLDKHLRETASVIPFGAGANAYAIWITSSWELERMRNEAPEVSTNLPLYIAGGDAAAKQADSGYQFNWFYRGIKCAVDNRPLRFNEIDQDNFPVLLQPYVQVAGDHGVEWHINPVWLDAEYEIGFLVYRYTFKRLVPEKLTKIGGATWPAQYSFGELSWKNLSSIGCNEDGDTGHFNYQIIRAFEPNQPWAVCPVMFKRCKPDYGFEVCTGLSEAGD
jgi:hypothetical protein